MELGEGLDFHPAAGETLPGSQPSAAAGGVGRESSLLSPKPMLALTGVQPGARAPRPCPPLLLSLAKPRSLERWLEPGARLGPEEGCCSSERPPLNAAREAQL